jgi:hypothetical protein
MSKLLTSLVLVTALVTLCGCPSKAPVGPVAPKPPPAAQSPAPETEGPSAPAQPLANWPKPLVAFAITGQQMGYIEPCGCTGLENQKGGLARRHTFLEQLKSDRGWTVVPLDVGGQVKRFGKQQEVKFATTVQGLRTMDYRAIGFGDGDLKLTPGELLAAIAGPDGTVSDFVSSNVAVLARELQPRYVVIEAGGKRIGVTAVLGDKYESRLRGDELVHEPAAAALQAVAAELKEKACDYYVLLASSSLEDARKLAEAAPLFDLVVASGETSLPSSEPETIGGKTRVLQVGQKAMYVAVIGLYDDPKTPIRYESIALDARFADSPAMLKLLADYQGQLKDHGFDGLGIKAPPHPSGLKFVGSEKCSECHSEAYKKWSETPHAHATDSLVKPPNSRGEIARHFDPECLSCHVTGWEPQQYHPYETGYLSLEQTPQLVHNGCENCHGPGSAHVAAESGEGDASEETINKLRDAMKLPLAGGIAERRCIECHDIDNSPDFHKPGAFEKYWKEVEHRGKN